MPELPEVETIVRELNNSQLVGCKIVHASVLWPRTISGWEPHVFITRISNQKILKITRLGKWLHFTLSQDNLFVHLRMTGKFFFGKPEDSFHSHERVRLTLDDGRCLRFEDQRKFGRWQLTSKEAGIVLSIGIDPLSCEYTYSAFIDLLKRSQKLKPFLLNQAYFAGLGNIYVDEALWEASLHPERLSNSLSTHEQQALYHAIPKVLKKGIANTGTTLGNSRANYYSLNGKKGDNQMHLNVFRRHGLACPRCGTLIKRLVVAQRGTHICPHCQALTDR
jgi:formamidopyrimidine-DNA glycosylase